MDFKASIQNKQKFLPFCFHFRMAWFYFWKYSKLFIIGMMFNHLKFEWVGFSSPNCSDKCHLGKPDFVFSFESIFKRENFGLLSKKKKVYWVSTLMFIRKLEGLMWVILFPLPNLILRNLHKQTIDQQRSHLRFH